MIRRPLLSLILVLATIGSYFTYTVVNSYKPLLGLDLQGGVEVILEPVDTPENLALATPDNLNTAVSILRQRVDAIGVAEPDITAQTGENSFIVVQLPGIDNQDAAVDLVGQTAELQFRPVLYDFAQLAQGIPSSEIFGPEITNGGPGVMNLLQSEFSDPNATPLDQSAIFFQIGRGGRQGSPILLGPSLFTGSALEGAQAQFVNGTWLIQVSFKSGPEGLDLFNEAAQLCHNASPQCPQQRLAFVLDGKVESAPIIEDPKFDKDVIISSRDGFDAEEAANVALALDFGALPLAFNDPGDPEAGLVRTVSATLGQDSLRAGLISAAVGLGLVALFMVATYRLLGLAAVASLGLSGAAIWATVSLLSQHSGLALTLAGIVGLIVSIGMSLDSNVIFFEDLKESVSVELQSRKVSAQNSPESRSGDDNFITQPVAQTFPRSFRTVFWANLATLIGAGILYFLTAGSVRGFALMLAIASVLDLIATYFFMAPLVRLMAQAFGDKPHLFFAKRGLK